MKRITMLAMAIIIAGMFHANAAKGEEANGIKVEKLWEVNAAPNANLYGVQFSPMDKYIIVAGGQAYYVMDAKDGKKIHGINNNSIWEDGKNIRPANNPRFIYNDTILLLENENKTTIDFHTFPDMRIIGSLQSTAGQIVTYVVSRDQKLLVANVDGEKLVLWDLETKKILKEKKIEKFEGEKSGAFSYPAFFPGRDSILVASTHVYFLGFDIKYNPIIKTVKTLNILNYELDSIGTLDASISKFSKDGKYVAIDYETGEGNNRQYVIDIIEYDTKKIIQTIHTGYFGTVGNYFITPDNKYLIAFIGRLLIFQLSDGKLLKEMPTGSCYGANISHDGTSFAFSSSPILYKYSFSEKNSVTNVSNSNYLQYSNPIIKDSIVLLIVGHSSKIKIVLSNERGVIIKELTNQYYEEGNYSIDLKTNDLPNGLYFLTLTDDSGSHTQKIIIER